ncbi:MAG: hypothetical protein AB2803_12730, partial [Candidatus Thiodiazotropha sp.]
MSIRPIRIAVYCTVCLASTAPADDSGRPPSLPPDADEIAGQVYVAAHGGLVRNALSKRSGREVALVVNRAPQAMRSRNRVPGVQTFETYVNHAPQDPAIEGQQMAILTSGKT